eukprot:TRINITY_DN30696_c0_g1_i1.p1 TRINITY_DN30696_c0_g1~~TRINITY_DN30696_c0_g1_i1.p1  ORF type:complete len:671 (+),score=152.37 TRINITY_DN30696_c0_g1_i1:50-2062(+)
MAVPPTLEVSVKIRPPHRRGVQHSVFGVNDDEGTQEHEVCSGVVACRLFTNQHQPKFPFSLDKVFPPTAACDTVYRHSVRHLVYSALGGGCGNVVVTGQPCGQPCTVYTELLLQCGEEMLRHKQTGGYRIEVSFITIQNEIAVDNHRPKNSPPLSLNTARRVPINTLSDLTDAVTVKDTTSHHIVSLYVTEPSGLGREGKVNFVLLSPGGAPGKQGIATQIFGKVLSGLATGKYVPYRESKLTFLLRSSLTASTHTLYLACIATTPQDFYASLSCLKTAYRLRSDNAPLTTGPLTVHFPNPREPYPLTKTIGGGVLNTARSPHVSPVLRAESPPHPAAPAQFSRQVQSARCSPIVAPIAVEESALYRNTSPVENLLVERFLESRSGKTRGNESPEPAVSFVRTVSPAPPVSVSVPAPVMLESSHDEMYDEEPSWTKLQQDIQMLSCEVEALRGGRREEPEVQASPQAALPVIAHQTMQPIPCHHVCANSTSHVTQEGSALDRLLRSQQMETARLLHHGKYFDNAEEDERSYYQSEVRAGEEYEPNPLLELYKQAEQQETHFLRKELKRMATIMHKGKVQPQQQPLKQPSSCTPDRHDGELGQIRNMLAGMSATSEAQQNYIEKLEAENKSLRNLHLNNSAASATNLCGVGTSSYRYPSHNSSRCGGEKEA